MPSAPYGRCDSNSGEDTGKPHAYCVCYIQGSMPPIISNLRHRKNSIVVVVAVVLAVLVLSLFIYFIFRNPNPTQAATLSLTTTDTTIQIDVQSRYRAVMQKGQTTDYLLIYDRAQNNSNPNQVFELVGTTIYEGGSAYDLRRDSNRKTTVLEATSTRVRVRVEGKLMLRTGSTYLEDTNGGDDIEAIEDITFTPEGLNINQTWNFKDGLGLDNTNWYDGLLWNTFLWDDANSYHTGTLIYGNGNTEGTISADGNYANSNQYTIVQAQGSYQDIFIGFPRTGWFDQSGGTASDWYYDYNAASNEQLIFREQGSTPIGKHYSQWSVLFKPQTDLDTEGEREALFNDLTNPDQPTEGEFCARPIICESRIGHTPTSLTTV